MTEENGRVPSAPGSHPAGHAACGVAGASRFDPSRLVHGLHAWAAFYEAEAQRLQNIKSDFLNNAGMVLRAVAREVQEACDGGDETTFLRERSDALIRSMATLACKNKYPKGVFGHEARAHYDEARRIIAKLRGDECTEIGDGDGLIGALQMIADPFALPPPENQFTRKWHCQHEEMLASAVEVARAAIGGGHATGLQQTLRDSDGSGEAGQTRSEAKGLDPAGDSAVRSDSEGIAQ